MDKTVIVERENGVATVRLNRPGTINAINNQMIFDLKSALEEVEEDDTVRFVVLTGTKPGFCSGADVKEAAGYTPKEYQWRMKNLRETYSILKNLSKPVIAAINGHALGGGCEMVALCDIRIATEGSSFGMVEGRVGTIAGGSPAITRLIGHGRAREFFFTAQIMKAQEAHSAGLVNQVVPEVELAKAVEQMIGRMRDIAPLGIKFAKAAMNRYDAWDIQAVFGELASQAIYEIGRSEDRKEALAAIREKRKPNFKGK